MARLSVWGRRPRITTAIVVPLAITAVVAVIVATADRGTVARPSASRPVQIRSGPVPPGPLRAAAGPKGYQPVDFGRMRLWVPRRWGVFGPNLTGCPLRVGTIFVDPGRTKPMTCRGPKGPKVDVRPLRQGRPGGKRSTINGYRVVSPRQGVYEVPALDVAINTSGLVPAQVLASLGASPQAVVLATGPTQSVPTGWRRVEFNHVHVAMPPRWPTVAGNHAGECGSPFDSAPVAYVGPGGDPDTSCGGGIDFSSIPSHDGLWLQSAQAIGGPTRLVTTPSGQKLRLSIRGGDQVTTVLYLDYHHVSIALGIGPNPDIARAVFASIGYDPQALNTPVGDVCPTWVHDHMPTPQRLRAKLVLSAGTIILEPPPSEVTTIMTATEAWKRTSVNTKQPGATYRLILASYFPHDEKIPGTNQATETPTGPGTLAWVVYATPTLTSAGACGLYAATIYNAKTGNDIDNTGYSPGP